MLHWLLQTEPDYIYLFLRVIAGLIIFPYGMQKLFGWFEDFGGGVGIKATLAKMRTRKVPTAIGWLIIVGQSFGSIALIIGCFTRIAAAGLFVIFTGAMLLNIKNGWTMNWTGKKKGEGIEYFVMLLSLLLVTIIKGAGPLSFDRWLLSILK